MGLFDRFRERESKEGEVCPAFLPDARMYCIGDIHGRADLLEQMHAQIQADVRGFRGRKYVLYLGDYVDRGDQSRQVIELLLEQPLRGFETIYLKGNHEQAMLDFMRHPHATAGWLTFGGRQTLTSYGISLAFVPLMKDLDSLAAELSLALPEEHLDFLESGQLWWRGGDYFFAHAGIRPGVDLEAQHPDDLLWIRGEFIDSKEDHGAVVVHGHTIFEEPEIRPNRISIDSGAFYTDVLTCLVLEGTKQRLLQTKPAA